MLKALNRGLATLRGSGGFRRGSRCSEGSGGSGGSGEGGVGCPVRWRERGCSPGAESQRAIKGFRGRAIGLVLGLGAIAASPATAQQWWPVRGFERNGGLTQDVWCVETLSDGSLVFGGNFTARDGSPIHRIARWNGCSWDNMGGGFDNGTVRALAEFRGELIAGGSFTTAAGTPTPGLARWDGTAWQPLPGVSSASVSTLVEWNNELLCEGLTRWDDGTSSAFVAAWDGVHWREFDSRLVLGPDFIGVIDGVLTVIGRVAPEFNSHVYQLHAGQWIPLGQEISSGFGEHVASWQGSLVIAGAIGFGGAPPQNRVAQWQLGAWVDLLAPFPGGAPKVASDGHTLFAAQLRGAPIEQFGRSRVAFTNGGPWAGFDRPTTAVNPNTIALHEEGLLLDDHLVRLGGDPVPLDHGPDWLLLWRGAIDGNAMLLARPRTLQGYGEPVLLEVGERGVLPGTLTPRPSIDRNGGNAEVTFARHQGRLVMGGLALSDGGTELGPLAVQGPNGWEKLGSFAPATNGSEPQVIASLVVGDDLYVGGFFGGVDGVVSPNIARFDGREWHAVGSGTNNSVAALAEYAGSIALAGWFTTAGGVPAFRVALWNGQAFDGLQGGLTGAGTVRAEQLLVFGSELYVRGTFQFAGGVTASALARWNGTAWQDVGVLPQPGNPFSPSISSVAKFNQGILVQGAFETANGLASRAIWDGTAWSPLPVDTLPEGSFGLIVVPGAQEDGLWAWSIQNMRLPSGASAWLARYGALPPEHRADLTGASDPADPSYGVPNGVLDMADFLYFLDQAIAGDARIADLTANSDPSSPCYGVPDGIIDISDFFAYLDRFVN